MKKIRVPSSPAAFQPAAASPKPKTVPAGVAQQTPAGQQAEHTQGPAKADKPGQGA